MCSPAKQFKFPQRGAFLALMFLSFKRIYFVCIIIVAALQRQTTVQKLDTNVREFLTKITQNAAVNAAVTSLSITHVEHKKT